MPYIPISPERTCDSVEAVLHNLVIERIVIQTRYGSHELTVDEIWTDLTTKTLKISVNLFATFS